MKSYSDLANSEIYNQPVYAPGKSIDLVAAEFNLNISNVIKLASNENSYGTSPLASKAIVDFINKVNLYPEGDSPSLRKALAKRHNLGADNIIIGNGSNELIELLGHVFLNSNVDVVVGDYSFIVYKLVSKLFGANIISTAMTNFTHNLDLMLNSITSRTRLIFLASPNNPTGTINTKEEIYDFIENLPDHVIFCFDEAYAEYMRTPPNLTPFIKRGKKIICLRTFSKIFGLSGLRIGYAYGHSELITLLNRVRQPFNINSIAQVAAENALLDEDFIDECLVRNNLGRKQLLGSFKSIGLEPIGSSANFIFLKVGDGDYVFKELQKKGIIIRPLNNYGLPEYIRITIGTEEQNMKLINQIKPIMVNLA